MPHDWYRFLLLPGELDFCWIQTGIELAADSQPGSSCRAGNQVNDRLVSFQRPAPPVNRDLGEQPVLNFIPFARSGRIVAHINLKARSGVQPGELEHPQPGPMSIGAAAISTNEDAPSIRVLLAPHFPPP